MEAQTEELKKAFGVTRCLSVAGQKFCLQTVFVTKCCRSEIEFCVSRTVQTPSLENGLSSSSYFTAEYNLFIASSASREDRFLSLALHLSHGRSNMQSTRVNAML